MINNQKGFSLMEMFLVLAILGIVTLQVPQFFSANGSMNSFFDIQTLLDRSHNRALQSLQNKKVVLQRLQELHSDELVRCLKQVNPTNNCAQFDMVQAAPLVWPGSVLDSRQSLQSEQCTANCLIAVKTTYKISCRASSCNSVEFLIATEKLTTNTQITNRIIEHKDVVLMGKNQFADTLTENMACTDANRGFMFGYNYLSRTGTCQNCGPSCYSPSGGFENSGVLKNELIINPKSITLDRAKPENIKLSFEIQQASNNILGKVSLTCTAGNKTVSLSAEQNSQMMSSLRQTNHYLGSWLVPLEAIQTGPQSFVLSCMMKGYDAEGTYLIAMSSADLLVYATEAEQTAADSGSGPGSGTPGPGGGNGFSAPTYSCP